MPAWLRRPVINQVLREAPAVEAIFRAEKNWAVSLIIVKQDSKNIGSSVAQVGAAGDIEIIGIDRADTYLNRPNWDERIAEGDRLLAYATRKAAKIIFD